MRINFRAIFPYLAIACALAALAWATSFGKLEPADFTFINGTEIKSVDPAKVSGSPEGRIINALFENLYRKHPKTLEPIPGMAASMPEISKDGKVYTITLKKNIYWSDHTKENPSRVTAHDFVWSWRRFLHPGIGAEYSYLLGSLVVNADKYFKSKVEVGNNVEVELMNRSDDLQVFPRGDILLGKVLKIYKSEKPKQKKDEKDKAFKDRVSEWKEKWVYRIKIKNKEYFYSKNPDEAKKETVTSEIKDQEIKECRHILIDFNDVGIKAIADDKLQITLNQPTEYFPHLLAFYPLHPVNRRCVEKHGFPNWTKAKNIVCNGAYRLKFRRIRDRIRLEKNHLYWDAKNVKLNTIDALAIEKSETQLNMFLNKQVDWATNIPSSVVPALEKENYFIKNQNLATYFYRFNLREKVFKNRLVRKALNMAMDKKSICDDYLKAGQVPARSLVPTLMKEQGYQPAFTDEYNPKKARALLSKAGYPGGKNFPKIEILYNTNEGHKTIAEMIQDQWQRNLGIEVELKNQEWGVFLPSVRKFQYKIARAAWIGDYPDPNTFLDMFVTDGENNQTGWSNNRYDEIINKLAPAEFDKIKRMKLLHEAEQILMDEQPVIPIYYYVIVNLVDPKVKGFYPNLQDVHPLRDLSIEKNK